MNVNTLSVLTIAAGLIAGALVAWRMNAEPWRGSAAVLAGHALVAAAPHAGMPLLGPLALTVIFVAGAGIAGGALRLRRWVIVAVIAAALILQLVAGQLLVSAARNFPF